MPGAAEGADAAFVGLLQHGNDVRVFVQVPDVGHAQHRAEAARDLKLLRRGEALVAEEQHTVLGQRIAHRQHGSVVSLGQVQASDLGAAGRRQRQELKGLGGHEVS